MWLTSCAPARYVSGMAEHDVGRVNHTSSPHYSRRGRADGLNARLPVNRPGLGMARASSEFVRLGSGLKPARLLRPERDPERFASVKADRWREGQSFEVREAKSGGRLDRAAPVCDA